MQILRHRNQRIGPPLIVASHRRERAHLWRTDGGKRYAGTPVQSSEESYTALLRMLYNRKGDYGAWLDPYGFARDAADVPGKKTYYIVDSERNAVVDVIHLGRWGQKWLNRRAKRQASKSSE